MVKSISRHTTIPSWRCACTTCASNQCQKEKYSCLADHCSVLTIHLHAGFPLQQQSQSFGSQGATSFAAKPPFPTPEALVSPPYGSLAQSRAGSPQHGQQAAPSGLAPGTVSQRGSSASQTSMMSFIAYDGVNDAPGLSWLYAQAPQ